MEENKYVAQYSVFLKLARMAAKVWPLPFAYRIASWVGKKFSPYRLDVDRTIAAIESGLGVRRNVAKRVWLDYLSQHGVFAANLFIHHKLTSDWITSHLTIRGARALDSLLANEKGTLLLTYHNPHKNTLGAVVGLLGRDVCGIAADPNSFPIYADLAYYLDMLHNDTAKHFGKGGYVFLRPGMSTVRSIHRAFKSGQVVISLNDNPNPMQRSCSVDFMGRMVPAPAGTVELAIKEKVPIYCAILYWERDGHFILDVAELKHDQGVDGVMREYFKFLEQIIESHPHVWEGWQWFDLLKSKQVIGDEVVDKGLR